MTHGHTRIPGRGFCIYCRAVDVALTDEHVVPYSMGGQHVLEDASCEVCADVTKKFEQHVARDMWGDARIAYGAPSRRKNKRPKHIVLVDPDNRSRSVRLAYSDYAPAMVFYKMSAAGLLCGLPETLDQSPSWKIVAVHDTPKANAFIQKYGMKLTTKVRNMSDSYARTLAKIAYCHVLTELAPADFQPICLPYIMGTKQNMSHVVGGSLDVPPPDLEDGYKLSTRLAGDKTRLLIIAEIRLFANLGTPIYHVVVGEALGQAQVANILRKYIEIGGITGDSFGSGPEHWSPRAWPVPGLANAI